MHISLANRAVVFETLFNEGVLVGKKDKSSQKHMYLDKIPNLQVMMLMRSLKSRGHVTETFSWNCYYWILTNSGIEYLRLILKIPNNCIPNTLKKSQERAPRGEFNQKPRDQTTMESIPKAY